MPKTFEAWSYSRLNTYEQCPLQAKLKFLDRLQEPDSPAMKRGKDIHAGIANWLTGKAEGLPREAMQNPRAEQIFQELRAMPDKLVEQQWGYTANWKPTGWFGADTWFRSILDLGLVYEDMTGEACDWKTGRRYGSNMEQMETQAVAMFARYVPMKAITVRLVYLDETGRDIEDIAEFKRHEMTSLQQKYEKRVARMFADTIFAPRPNDKCRFCAFGRNKGGQCAFG